MGEVAVRKVWFHIEVPSMTDASRAELFRDRTALAVWRDDFWKDAH